MENRKVYPMTPRTKDAWRMFGKRAAGRFWSLFRLLLLIGLSFALLYPILYMVSMAVRAKADLYDITVEWIPKHFTLENLQRAFTALNYPAAVLFTFFLAFTCACLCAITGSLTGYGLSRFKFRGQGVLFAVVLLTIIIPATFYRMPSYLLFNQMHLLNTPFAMILPALLGAGIRSGLYVYLFRQFYKGFPKEMEEAARIDGCGNFMTYLRIAVPSSVPVFVTAFLFSFVWYWNDFQLSKIFIQDFMGARPLSASLANLSNMITAAFGSDAVFVDKQQFALDQQAACLLVIGPLLLLYIVLQRFFVESIQRSGLAGD